MGAAAGIPGSKPCNKVYMSVNPFLGGGVGFGACTPSIKHCSKLSNSVGTGLGGDAGNTLLGSNRLSKVSNFGCMPSGPGDLFGSSFPNLWLRLGLLTSHFPYPCHSAGLAVLAFSIDLL